MLSRILRNRPALLFLTASGFAGAYAYTTPQTRSHGRVVVLPCRPQHTSFLARVLSTAALESSSPQNAQPDDVEASTDDFISRLFGDTRLTLPSFGQQFPSLQAMLNEKIAKVHPTFVAHLEQLQKSYETLWEFLTVEDFRRVKDEIEQESCDPSVYEELNWDASVRQSPDLCREEQNFIQARRERQRTTFAKFIGVNPREVEVEDIPVVGIAASGGGYRAMLGSVGYLRAMEETGAMETIMYIAGVSGSCWTMAQFYSPLANGSTKRLAEHLQTHVQTHLANVSSFISLLKTSHDNAKLMMRGVLERYKQQNGAINLVDIFGMFLGGALLTTVVDSDHTSPENHRLLSHQKMGLTKEREVFQDGSHPMPIYCCVHHDLTVEDKEQDNTYQWFEFTPYEMGSEELNAWIPMWAFGRKFKDGENTLRAPEATLSTMMGVFGSAFAASLAHFYNEIRGFVPEGALAKADEIIVRYQNSMSAYHPISPACFPNPFYGLRLPKHMQSSALPDLETLCIADAGMDNNIPFYPLLRDGRDVDVIVAIDLSADIQEAPHFERAEGYAKRRNIDGWPAQAGWPKKMEKKVARGEYPLGTCTVFASTTQSQRPITVVYYPLIKNKEFDPDFDPQTAEFCSTWNFVYSKDQVVQLFGLADRNWRDNVGRYKEVLRAAWERKRNARLSEHHTTSRRDAVQLA